MKFILTLVTLIILTISSYSQDVKLKKKPIHIKAIAKSTGVGLIYAHVVNLNNLNATTTNKLGIAEIKCNINDTLKITSIGFEDYYFKVDSLVYNFYKINIVKIKEKTYQLNNISINRWIDWDDFKYELLHMKLPYKYDAIKELNLKINKRKTVSIPIMYRPDVQRISVLSTIFHPLSTLQYFGRRNKHMLKMMELYKNRDDQYELSKKYNKQVIKKALEIEGEELEQFLIYCNAHNNFTGKTSELDIIKTIHENYKNFKNKKSASQ